MSELPVIECADIDGTRTASTIHGVVLAGGTSSRYGDANKLLATVAGEPIVRHAARTLVRSSLDATTVVLGHDAERVRAALAALEAEFTVNTAYRSGQSTSVREGVRSAQRRNADAILVALGDMPTVTVETIDRLRNAYESTEYDAIAAGFDGQRGNPVLFDARYFDSLADIAGDSGGRELLLSSETAAVLETDDPGVLEDLDSPDDLESVSLEANADEQ